MIGASIMQKKFKNKDDSYEKKYLDKIREGREKRA
jgi:hypothetical protein